MCIDRRCVCIVGLLLSEHFAAKCSFADVCLNKWIDLCKVLVSFWFDRENRFWGVAVVELLS